MSLPEFSCRSCPIGVILLIALLLSVAVSSAPGSQTRSPLLAVQDVGGAAAVGDDKKIEEIMERMKSAGRSFRRALRGNKIEDALAQVQKAQVATLESKDLVPDMVAEMEDPKERLEGRLYYRLWIIAILDHWLDIERALLVKDTKTAGEVAKKISELKKRGHQRFRKEED